MSTRSNVLPSSRLGDGLMVTGSVFTLLVAVYSYVAPSADQLWLGHLQWIAGGLVAALGVALVRRTSAGVIRSGWTALLAASMSFVVGVVIYGLTVATQTTAPTPSVADLCWFATAIWAAIGVHRLAGSGRPGRQAGLELAALGAATCSMLGALLWRDIMASQLTGTGVLTTLLYPVLYGFAALVMLQSVVSGTLDVRHDLGLATLLCGMALEGIAFAIWTPLLLTGTYVVGAHVIDGLWSVGFVLIGLGAWRSDLRQPPGRSRRSGIENRGGLLPTIIFIILFAIQIAFTLRITRMGPEMVLSAGLAIVGLLLVALYSQTNKQLLQQSRADALTGIGNRLRLFEDLETLAARETRYAQGYCVALCDLDYFKRYNDSLGHQAGDEVLRSVARLLQATCRTGDGVYRYGGEELLLLLPAQDLAAGREAAERHRRAVEAARIEHPDNAPFGVVTMSLGVAACNPGEHPADVLRRADEAMYDAKRLGRNRVVVAAGSTAA